MLINGFISVLLSYNFKIMNIKNIIRKNVLKFWLLLTVKNEC